MFKSTFAFTYYGPALDMTILNSLTAKSHESCRDEDTLRYSLIHTSKPKRASWIEAVIDAWSQQQSSEEAKVRFKSAELDQNVISLNKATAEDHFITKTIRSKLPTYERWECDRLTKALEIDMINQAPLQEQRDRKRAFNPEPAEAKRAPKRSKLSKRAQDAAEILDGMGSPPVLDSKIIEALDTALEAKNQTISALAAVIASKDETIRVLICRI